VAQAQSKRQSRKRRRAAAGSRPAASPTARARPERPSRPAETTAESLATILTGRTYGERPSGVFHPVPVSEIAIFAGLIGVIVGAASANRTALITGIAVCVLGVLEVTGREHFSGYRSHATLLAAVPAVGLVAASVAAFGTPSQRGTRELMLAAAVPVFGVLFWALRKRFRSARQARIIRPPAA
jgi:hypothetical protein